MINVIYPKIIIKNRIFLINLLGYGDSNDEVFGVVKKGIIEFKNRNKIKNDLKS